jgi:Rad3-related DNA helicase
MAKSKHTFRLINYENSKEKAEVLELFKKKEGGVLVGPSLLEGLDLKDDTSRFQIFFKVPYPSLGSPHIKAKMDHMPEWYSWKTAVNVSQGVGRSVRSKDDWCITYLLDGCFSSILNSKTFNKEFLNRIVRIN